jgi:hypothetical protein
VNDPFTGIFFLGVTVPANGFCSFSFNVIATAPGFITNRTTTATSNEALPGDPASATVYVDPSPWLWFFAS